MSTHIEWLAARETSVQVFTPGEHWVGAGEHRQPVLTLAGDDVVAIQGTPAELRALAAMLPRRRRASSSGGSFRCWCSGSTAAGGGCLWGRALLFNHRPPLTSRTF